MKGSIESIIGVIRAGPDFQKFGDPFEFSCTLIRRGDKCEIVGASGKLTLETYKAIREALEGEGITVATWERASKKKVVTHKKGAK